MAYDVPFSLNPTSTFAFDPSNRSVTNPSEADTERNPYVPLCDDSSSLARENYRSMTESYVNSYGMIINYQSTGFGLATQNKTFGEDPTARFRGPRKIKAIVDFSSYTTFISRFGMASDLEITIYIPIAAFKRVWGNVVPLVGDLFTIEGSACDRPLQQSPIVFEVTEKHDSINPVDYMGGHYVWKIVAQRYDNSYEPGALQEKDLGGPVESDYGKIESTIDELTIIPNPSGYDVDEQAKEDFQTPNDDVYGNYFDN